jgi:hypothetical protein
MYVINMKKTSGIMPPKPLIFLIFLSVPNICITDLAGQLITVLILLAHFLASAKIIL